MVSSPVTKCIFCGSTNLSREHVFPEWSHKYMRPRKGKKQMGLSVIAYPTRRDTKLVPLHGENRDWKVKCVCGKCNNGWMSDLEKLVKPLMLPMIKGESIILDPSHQTLIATWAVLKAMVAQYRDSKRDTPHHLQRKYLRARLKPPNQWGVWIAGLNHVFWKGEWTVFNFLYPSPSRKNPYATYYNGHTTTQVIGKLLIHVIHTPPGLKVDRWGFTIPTGASLFRIFPVIDHFVMWPGQFMLDEDADYLVNNLRRRILDAQRRAGITAPPVPQ